MLIFLRHFIGVIRRTRRSRVQLRRLDRTRLGRQVVIGFEVDLLGLRVLGRRRLVDALINLETSSDSTSDSESMSVDL